MRKRVLSLFVTAALLLSCMACLFLPVSAEIPEPPDAFPDGRMVDSARLWTDWSALGLNSDAAAIDGEYLKITTQNKLCWSGSGNTLLPEPTAWRGADGLMFYLDANGCSEVEFMLALMSDGTRPKADGTTVSFTQFNTVPTTGGVSTAYFRTDGEWEEVTSANGYLGMPEAFSGWVYLPFTSIWYRGGSGQANDAEKDSAFGTDFVTFMSNFEKARVIRASIVSHQVGLRFGDLHLVYADAAPAAEHASAASLFGQLTASTLEGGAQSAVDGGAVKVSGLTGNSGSKSSARAWVKGISVSDPSGAAGLRFYVDSSKLDVGAALQLRLRLMSNTKVASTTTVYKNGVGNLVSSSTFSNPQFTCSANNSVAYYYDDEGNPVALHVQDNVSTNAEGDLFEALPSGYKGYVYIPFDSFWMSGTSYANRNLALPFSVAGGSYPFDQLAICHAISGQTASDEVTYRNFEVVYEDTAFTGASLTLTNNLNVNFFAKIEDDTVAPTVRFHVGSSDATVQGEKQADGSYRFTCSAILPQKIGDRITAILTAKVGEHTVTETMHYSVQEYCERMLAREDASPELKTLLVDLLCYGAAAQEYAGYSTDSLVTANLSANQLALRSPDRTGEIDRENQTSGTASEDYRWVSAALQLDSSLALRLRLEAADTEGLTAEVTLNGRTSVYDEFDAAGGSFSLIFENIGITELNDSITLTLKRNGEAVGEQLTVSVAAYIKGLLEDEGTLAEVRELVRALWGYSQSASAYAV